MSLINTDLSKGKPWIARKGFNNQFTISFLNASVAYDISSYVFVLNIKKVLHQANVLQLSQSSGLTNGGASGVLTVQLSEANSNLLRAAGYYYEINYTVSTQSYGLLHGTLTLLDQYDNEQYNQNLTVNVNLAGTDVTMNITLAGGSGGGIQSIQAGTNISVDNTDPLIPVVSSTGGGITSVNGDTGPLVVLNASDVGADSAGSAAAALASALAADAAFFLKSDGVLTPVANPAYALGKVVFNSTNDILEFMNSNNMVRLQIGHELWTRVYNNSGSTILNGKAVYVSGTDAGSGLETIALSRADSINTMRAIGIATHNIPNNSIGIVTSFGQVNDIDTSGYSANTVLYLSPTTAGEFVTTPPLYPNYTVRIGRVIVSNSVTGRIQVTPPTYSRVEGLETVIMTADVINNNATPNTIQDVTGLSFPVDVGTYYFKFIIFYTAQATTTGSAWSVNGPAFSNLGYVSVYQLTTTAQTTSPGRATYDNPSAANGTSAQFAGNLATIEGFVTTTAPGTIIARFVSEVAGSAITAKAGSFVQYKKTF